ncbi:hypothetical protein VTO73DRAFT_3474 [Trametes versicolor]
MNPIASLWESVHTRTDGVTTRMGEYMRHVRDIRVKSGTISPSLLTELATPLLPNLRRLDWVVPFKATIQPFWPLIVPSLTTVHVDVSLDSSPLQDAEFLATLLDGLNAIARRCASLTTIEILWIYGSLLPSSAAVLDALSSLLSLKALSASTNVVATREALQKLSKLPSLRSLQICHFDQTNLDGVDFVAASSGFESLQAFSIEGSSSLVQNLLDGMPRCGVRQCTVALQGYARTRLQEIITEGIARKFGPSLDTLSLSLPCDFQDIDYQRITRLSATIFHTLRTINLVDVRLAWLEADKISDALCEDLAASWPRLRVLHLTPFESPTNLPSSGTTLRGLRHFAERCPALEETRLQVDATGDHWADEAGSVPAERPRTRAVSLDLITSPVTSPEAVAVYLKACFHRVSELSFSRVEARMYRCGDRIAAWDRLCALLLSDDKE